MAATSGTRRGNGSHPPGWGGPAKGAGKKGAGHGQGRPDGVKDGQGKQAQARAALEDALPLAVQTVIGIAGDITDQRALQAASNIIDRVLGKVGDKLTVAGDADAPLVIRRIIIDPKGPDGHSDAASVSAVSAAE
jgi:hypothetical protein